MKEILFADDNKTIRLIMENNLQELGYNYVMLEDGTEVEKLIESGTFPPLVILDWEMPGKTGPELCTLIKQKQQTMGYLTYVILCTTRDTTEDLVKGFNAGADDYISKPFNLSELKARIMVGNRILRYQEQIAQKEFDIRVSCYNALTELAETHCLETASHLHRISETTSLLAKWAGQSEKFQRNLSLFSPMHDIGKVSVPESLLYLPRKLTDDEFNLVKNHTLQGWKILKDKPTLEMAAEIALTHHEHWDGSGYPQHLDGKNIPLSGRITAICDVYDSLRSKRSFKEAWNHQETMDFIYEQKGKAFDPELVDLFIKYNQQFMTLYTEDPVESITIKDII